MCKYYMYRSTHTHTHARTRTNTRMHAYIQGLAESAGFAVGSGCGAHVAGGVLVIVFLSAFAIFTTYLVARGVIRHR